MTQKKSVTIIDIADYLGISHTTVSRALNGSQKVKEITRRKVIDAAHTLNYSPNLNARGLNQGRSYIIGLFFTDLQNGTSSLFLTSIITSIKSQLPANYVLSINAISDDGLANTFDGVVIVSQSARDQPFIDQFVKTGIPLVVLNRHIENPKVINYWLDNYNAARELTTHALSQGYKNVALIRGDLTYTSTTERSRGFYDAIERWLDASDYDVFVHPPVEGEYSVIGGYNAMSKLLRRKSVPEYVFIENDDMAIGALHAINESNDLAFPISVSGFDDVSFASYTTPALTTVHSPVGSMTELGIRALKNLISNDSIEDVPFRNGFDMPIVYRDTLKK
ncbi:LacI family DNA-binding transcriptional regulator [Leuconostoc citreum]|uniref:LacI family DNA-binding transcriptional regulator n=1 Tax=Leuconostoc citreum TaxID=33964 RepID=UPI0011BBE0EB|nr:LacI family DNA-binding transcriptional regulator [Leuconostoc citreum]QEA37565.1 LacI family transcriptional regulator [Leuconostoc citreum]